MSRIALSFIVLCLLIPLSAELATPTLYPAELRSLEEMLSSADLDKSSLQFEKDWDLSTKFKQKGQLAALQNPWLALDQITQLREILARPDSLSKLGLIKALGTVAAEQEIISPEAFSELKDYYTELWADTVRQPKDIFRYMEKVYAELNETLIFALPFDQPKADSLRAFSILALSESEDSTLVDKYLKANKLPKPERIEVLDRVEDLEMVGLPVLQELSLKLYAVSEVIAESAKQLKFPAKRMERTTRWGRMIIGSRGDDSYSESNQPICFLLEPSGRDKYLADINTSPKHPFYLLLDLSGDDLYENKAVGGLFSVNQGIGVSLDLAGDDVYRSGNFSFCGILGAMIHYDVLGEDVYTGGAFSQGAAFFGSALLIEGEGDDSYQAPTMAQGLGSTRGLGAILDFAGTDRYLLGAKYTHAPLMPNDFRSMGQGMGFGFRPDFAGGTGLLYDRSGNDKYIGAVYAQGVGYWYATGILIDEQGNDVYNAVYYPQGSGIHLANGYLFDGEGDDAYYTRNGPGQGAGHDWALGILLDKSGDDAYSIPGGNGLGLNNSVGIFVDSKGNDRYERVNPSSYGYANFSRSAGAIGLFLDGAGTDSYPDSSSADNTSWQRGNYGIGKDMELFEAGKTAVQQLAEDAALVDSLAAISEVFSAASEWEVGSAVKRVQHARKVLVSRPQEATDYILENKLDSKSGLEYRALEDFLAKVPAFKTRLYDYLENPDSLKAKNALALIAGTSDSLLIEPVKKLLARKKYVTACLGTMGSIKGAQALAILREYMNSPVERYRYIVARSLLSEGSPEAKALLLTMRDDPSFLVQSLVRNQLEKKP
ncbi:MAG TPA: HEAT repeat domain-containing protein [Candidatus Cloacimonadota bacterium]|nr:HEAT repeat domain-containing protein [Candidatus Cloacimonadota bacterium]